ncbi:hypothetical protein Tco_1202174 [Tanacetum coccineum]
MADWAAVDVGWVVGYGRGGKPGGGVGVGGWVAGKGVKEIIRGGRGQDIGILGDMPAVEGRRLSRTGESHLDAVGREKVKKLGVVELTTMVTLEPTNVTFKLVFNIRSKIDKFMEYFKFMAKRVNP